jgi:hypothetical protein
MVFEVENGKKEPRSEVKLLCPRFGRLWLC